MELPPNAKMFTADASAMYTIINTIVGIQVIKTIFETHDKTAMGTPMAPLYSILSFGVHENQDIINSYPDNLMHYTFGICSTAIWITILEHRGSIQSN